MSDSDHSTYTCPETLVKAAKSCIYFSSGDEALYKVTELRFTGYEWGFLDSWVNNTDGTDSITLSYTSELKVTSGTTSETNWGLGAEFKGLSMNVGGSNKTFSSEETSESTTKTITVQIPPHSSVYLYQKVYKFKARAWFILDAWGSDWTVGSQGGYVITAVSEDFDVKGTEYITTGASLSGSDSTKCTAVNGIRYPTVRKFENCTQRCKNYLSDRGLP